MKIFLFVLLLMLIPVNIFRHFKPGPLFDGGENEKTDDDNDIGNSEQKGLYWQLLALYGVILLASIFISYVGAGFLSPLGKILNGSYLLVGTVWWILMFPGGEIMGTFLRGYYEPEGYDKSGLEEAGKIIGQTERTLVFIFYLGNSLSGVAFLIVAKSILRFRDLQKGSGDEGETDENDHDGFSISEYIILGTLLSIALAVLSGVLMDLIVHETALEPVKFVASTSNQ